MDVGMSRMSGCQPSVHTKIFGITDVNSVVSKYFYRGMSGCQGCQAVNHLYIQKYLG